MTADELSAAGNELFGSERGWQSRFAAALNVDRATLTRWLSGQSKIPGPVAVLVKMWLVGYRRTGRRPSL